MKNTIGLGIISTIVFSSLFLSKSRAQSKSDGSLEEVKRAIAESNTIYYQSYSKNDSSLFMNRYTEDCIIRWEYGPVVRGHKGALDLFKASYDEMGLRNGKLVTKKVYATKDGYFAEEGLWQSRKNNQYFDSGTFFALWKKTSKGWKTFRHNFTSDSDHIFK